MTLDGNAAAGILRQVFAVEMTEALGTCAGCGAVEAVGAAVVYERAPGMVLRCPHCEAVLAKLSTDGEIRKEWMERSLEMAKLIGMTNLAPVEDIYLTTFRPVPTMA